MNQPSIPWDTRTLFQLIRELSKIRMDLVEAVGALDNILRRMQAHQNKKQSMLRSLDVARNFSPNERG